MGSCRFNFLLYARLVLPVMFLLQAFTITKLFDSDTEQGTNGLRFLREPVQPFRLNNFIMKNLSVKPLN